MSNAAVPAGLSKLRVMLVNPLEHEAELKALMTAHGNTAFEGFFDRGYRDVVAEGGANWVGVDDAGQIQISLTQFVHTFQFQATQLVAGMTGNVMAAQAYRTFFPAFALFRRMLFDTRDRGEIDFVYGDPTPAATAICKAVKMDHVGNLDRLVLPIADVSFPRHLAARLLAHAPLILGGKMAPDLRCCSAATKSLDDFGESVGPDDRMIPRHPISLLRRQLPGFPASNDFVVELRYDRAASSWDALVLLRLADRSRILSILSMRRRPDVPLRAVIPALAPLARRLGAHRLQIETLLESRLAREFRSLGFRARGDILPILVKSFSSAGKEAIRNVAQWEVTSLDMERAV